MMKLRKSAFAFIIVFIGALLLPAGCGKTINRALPEQSIEFHTGTFVNPSNAEDSFRSIEYNKRIYIPFGALNGSLNDKDVGVYSSGRRKNERRYSLSAERRPRIKLLDFI